MQNKRFGLRRYDLIHKNYIEINFMLIYFQVAKSKLTSIPTPCEKIPGKSLKGILYRTPFMHYMLYDILPLYKHSFNIRAETAIAIWQKVWKFKIYTFFESV